MSISKRVCGPADKFQEERDARQKTMKKASLAYQAKRVLEEWDEFIEEVIENADVKTKPVIKSILKAVKATIDARIEANQDTAES